MSRFPTPVEIVAPGGVTLRGQRTGTGADWVLLLHDAGPEEDLDRWQPLVAPLAAAGYAVLALDLRGHGVSDGDWAADRLGDDLAAAVAFARAAGARRLAVAAIGGVATAVLRDAVAHRLDALILLTPALTGDEPTTSLRAPGVPKLLLTGAGDAGAIAAAARLRNASIGWALSLTLPTTTQGADLLAGEAISHLREQVLGFLRQCRLFGQDPTPRRPHPAGGEEREPTRTPRRQP